MISHYVLSVLFIITNGHCAINNVCRTYEDYRTIDDNPECWHDVAADSNATTIIQSNGYPLEIHKVTTSDGYIITLFRIPNNQFQHNLKKEPVLLVHGFLASGACFIGLGKESLGFTLADAGHDVWISNSRGTIYSLENVLFSYHTTEFWNYNVDQMSLIDIPLQLRYISEKTGQNGNIIYVGHSLGTTAALMYGSRYPQEVRKMVKLFIMLAPHGGLKNTKSVIFRLFAPFIGILVKLFNRTELAKFLAPGGISAVIRKVCGSDATIMPICVTLLNILVLGPQVESDASTVPIMWNQFPAGSSIKVFQQISEASLTELRAYDYGLENFKHYGQLSPPLYNVSNINVPIYLVFSGGDWLTTKADSELLFDRLSLNSRRYGKYEITEEGFNHFDFLFNRNAKTLLYNRLLNLIDRIRNL